MKASKAAAIMDRRAAHLRCVLEDWKGSASGQHHTRAEVAALEKAIPLMRAVVGGLDALDTAEGLMFQAYDALLAAAERFTERGEDALAEVAARLAQQVGEADPRIAEIEA